MLLSQEVNLHDWISPAYRQNNGQDIIYPGFQSGGNGTSSYSLSVLYKKLSDYFHHQICSSWCGRTSSRTGEMQLTARAVECYNATNHYQCPVNSDPDLGH